MTKVAIIPGDGVGPEVMAEASKLMDTVTKAFHVDIEVVNFDLGADYYLETGLTLPEGVVAELSDGFRAILLGPLGDPRVQDDRHAKEILWGLVRELDLFAGLRHIKLLSLDLCPLANKTEQDIDLILVWEGLGGLYSDVGGALEKGTEDEVVIEQDVATRRRVERVMRFAFDYAVTHDRSKVTMVHKSRAYPYGQDLWIRTFHEVREDYARVGAFHLHMDTFIQQILSAPEEFDVVVTNHLFGSILSALGTGLQGGQGLVASANLRPGKMGLFRPLHPSSTKYAGKDYANPMAAMLCVLHMLEFTGHPKVTATVEAALKKALESGWVTRDLGGSMGTREVGDFICSAIMEAAG